MQYLYTVILLLQYLLWVLLIHLVIYSNTHIETVSCRFFWRMIAQDCNIVAPPTAGWRHRGRKQRNQTEQESVRVLLSPPRSSTVPLQSGSKVVDTSRVRANQVRSGQTGSTTTPTRRLQLTLNRDRKAAGLGLTRLCSLQLRKHNEKTSFMMII